MGAVETLLAWDTVARHNVNKRAAELSVGHLIHIGDRVIKLAPKVPPVIVPVAKEAMKKGPANWVAATRLAGLVSPVIIGKRMFTPAIMPAIPKVIVTSLITAPNALLLAAAGVGVDRLAHGLAARALRPHVIGPSVVMRISSVKDGRCLTKGGLGLGFTRCGAAGTDEWRFERTAPRVPLTRQAVLGLVHGADGTRFFAVAEPDPPGTWWPSTTPTVRLCADRWCARSVSRGADDFVSPAADAYAALAHISRCSSDSSALVTLLPPARPPTPPVPGPPEPNPNMPLSVLAVYAMVLVGFALAAYALATRLVEQWHRRCAAAIAAQKAREQLAVAAKEARITRQGNWHLPTMAPYLNPEMQPRSPGSSRARPIERQNSWERCGSRPSNPNPNPNPEPNLTSPGTARACRCRP